MPKPSKTDFAKAFNKKERDVYIDVYEPKDTIHNDQMEKFLKQSKAGHDYIIVMVHVNSSVVLAEPMKRQTAVETIRFYLPNKHILNNKYSEELKEVIQNVPPGSHCTNLAEVVIKLFKQHFVSILAGTAINFPLSFWHELLPQTSFALNLLRKPNATPTVLAHVHLCGQHDYNA